MFFAALAGAILFSSACAAETAPGANPPNPRLVLLKNFSDGGLVTGARTIRIYLPPGYATGTDTYRVLYFNDGGQAITSVDPKADPKANVHVDQIMDALLAQGLIYPAILVGIDSGPNGGRSSELTTSQVKGSKPTGHIEDYYKFIATILKPYVDSHYRTKRDPPSTGIVGWSFGGLAACYLAVKHPETFAMAGCMSPSFWWDEGKFLKSLPAGPLPKVTSRFWFDCAPEEAISMWQGATQAARTLIAHGWTEGDNVALQMDYPGHHDTMSWHRRAPSMLYFLLRREPPRLTGLAIKQLYNDTGGPINLIATADYPYVTLEAQYEHDFRTNPVNAVFTVTNPQLATVDSAGFNEIRSLAHGETTLTSTYGGLSATQTLQTCGLQDIPPSPKFSCSRAAKNIVIDGDLSDWPDLPLSCESTPSSAQAAPPASKYHFAVSYGEGFLYLAVAVIDDHLLVDPKRPMGKQDGIEIRLDARPDPLRSFGRGLGESANFLLLAASPGIAPGEPTIYHKASLPKGTLVACVKTKTGYALEAAIPSSYLDEKQKAPWQEFRLNVCIDDATAWDKPIDKYWWKPDWRTPQNVPGSGTFIKAP